MQSRGWKTAIGPWLVVAATIPLSGCAGTTASGGDAGCLGYAIARAQMPPAQSVPAGAWGAWIADLDDRMTGTCR